MLRSIAFSALCFLACSSVASAIPLCSGGDRAARKVTCIVDGDTGWEHGIKWRMLDIDTPEIDHAECSKERQLGELARDQLRSLMDGGYKIEWAHEKGKYHRNW